MKKLSLALIGGSLLFLACSAPYREAPRAENYKATTQKKLQAMYHWKLISEDFAKFLSKKVANPVYIVEPRDSEFEKTFVDMLKSDLINDGVLVKRDQKGAYKVKVSVNVVKFSKDRDWWNDLQGVLTAIGSGVFVASKTTPAGAAVGGVAAGEAVYAYSSKYSSTPQYEISISAFVYDDEKYIAAINRVYYIKDSDFELYLPGKCKNGRNRCISIGIKGE